jgi:lipopolysaccharide assembly protein A
MSMKPRKNTAGPQGRRPSPKLIVAGILAVLAAVFIAQNTDSVGLTLLFFDFSAPAWLMFVILLLVGVAIGFLLRGSKKE